MVMLHLFQALNYPIAVAHVNFQLRGADSDADEAFVKTHCDRHRIPFFSTRSVTNNYATAHGLSIQMAARELRYDFFKKVMDEEDYSLLATAHHLNDSLETVLLNWVHGASLEALGGIAVKRDNIIRPLLFATREELLAYAKEENIAWREDSSNQASDYQRNFIRHQVIPLLKEINPSLEATQWKKHDRLQSELGFYTASAKAWKEENVIRDKRGIKISKSVVQRAAYPALMLWQSLKEFDFSYEQCEGMVTAAQGQPGKQFTTSSHALTVDRDYFLLTPVEADWNETVIAEGQTHALLGPWQMHLEQTARLTPDQGSQTALLDAAKLVFPLRWRKWQAGDHFYPLGMTHRKKISDFLIDNKIPAGAKERVTVVESAGEIVWVAGHRIDERFKITPQSASAFLLSVQEL